MKGTVLVFHNPRRQAAVVIAVPTRYGKQLTLSVAKRIPLKRAATVILIAMNAIAKGIMVVAVVVGKNAQKRTKKMMKMNVKVKNVTMEVMVKAKMVAEMKVVPSLRVILI